ncbi:MAG TPA: hypothetical protein VFW96_23985 [Thermomicrobiales bacterium]|nr:hypothetical protein [Thermomicrobiales bacterium]
MQDMAREMERTTFVKKVITDLPAPEVLARAQEFFAAQGYRAGRGGMPNTVRLMGRNEGALPTVIGEIGVRTTNRGRTVVSLSGYGERLSQRLVEFHEQMRAARAPKGARPAAPGPERTPPRAESRAEILEEEALEAAEAGGADAAERAREREKYEEPGRE